MIREVPFADAHAVMHGALKIGERLQDIMHRDDSDFTGHSIRWLSEEAGRKAKLQFRLPRSDGRWLYISAQARNAGTQVHLRLVIDDLATALRAETQMRRAVEGSLQGVVAVTGSEVVFVNDGYARLVGFSSARELKATPDLPIYAFIHPDDKELVFEHIRARAAGLEAISNYEFRLVRRDGTQLWVQAIVTAFNWDGKRGSLAWLSDINDRKMAEAALIKAKETAEIANRSKTEFLANMSHELRTPLNAVIGFAEIIRDEIFGPTGTPKYREYADDICRSGRHLLDIINDILDLAKLEAGKLELRESNVAVPGLVDECVSLVRPKIEQSGLSVEVASEVSGTELRADARALRQVLLNFLSNAIKFTPPGGKITVRSALVPRRGFELSVCDTGIGMSKAEIKIALAPFGQIDSKLARQHVGTGLGLPLSQSLLRLHGGDVVIESEPGHGTTMIASFPMSRVVSLH